MVRTKQNRPVGGNLFSTRDLDFRVVPLDQSMGQLAKDFSKNHSEIDNHESSGESVLIWMKQLCYLLIISLLETLFAWKI